MSAWGVPSTLTASLALLQHLLPLESRWNPHIGYRHCWLAHHTNFHYFYLPTLLLLLLNCATFLVLVAALAVARRKTRVARHSTNRSTSHLTSHLKPK